MTCQLKYVIFITVSHNNMTPVMTADYIKNPLRRAKPYLRGFFAPSQQLLR